MKRVQGVEMAQDMPTFSVTLHRWQAGNELIGCYLGNDYYKSVAVKGNLVLVAKTKPQLTMMVLLAVQDGWRRKL
jgi:hypothetical protein